LKIKNLAKNKSLFNRLLQQRLMYVKDS